MNEIDKNYSGKIEIFKIDVDERQDVAVRYGITAMPTLIFFKDGVEVERKIGFMEKAEVESIINELKNK